MTSDLEVPDSLFGWERELLQPFVTPLLENALCGDEEEGRDPDDDG